MFKPNVIGSDLRHRDQTGQSCTTGDFGCMDL